jgi:NAD-dependent SIR2 family protein deacetylase
MGPNPKVVCEVHGQTAWEGHLECTDCGATYTTKDESAPTHAPPRCRNCGKRLMPIPGAKAGSHYYSAQPFCAICYEKEPGGAFQDAHDRDSPFCLGENCRFHGPFIRKLKRRVERDGKGQRDAQDVATTAGLVNDLSSARP